MVIPLIRLDLGGAPHRNPDDEEISTPHLLIYKEGFGTKWAYTAPVDKFTDLDDVWQTYEDFIQYCNITKKPNMEKELYT